MRGVLYSPIFLPKFSSKKSIICEFSEIRSSRETFECACFVSIFFTNPMSYKKLNFSPPHFSSPKDVTIFHTHRFSSMVLRIALIVTFATFSVFTPEITIFNVFLYFIFFYTNSMISIRIEHPLLTKMGIVITLLSFTYFLFSFFAE